MILPTFFRVAIFVALLFGVSLCAANPLMAQKDSANANSKEVLVHYMPWYESKPVSGNWGWHWTMNHFNPDQKRNGRRSIASHDYPLIGPYDSNDPHALECHVLMMKLAGVNGVVIDWYGVDKFRDYGLIHRNTLHLIRHVKKAGMKFAICYEDQTVKHRVESKNLASGDALKTGLNTLKWMDENWFSDKSYLTYRGKPILMVFGPQYFQPNQWRQMVGDLKNSPTFLGLPHLYKKNQFGGKFGWPPVTGGKAIPPATYRKYLNELYRKPQNQSEVVAAIAFPGFHDIYKQAKVGNSFGFIDARSGKTFSETLDAAFKSQAPIVQIATWNDFGEGTVIEPTLRNQYQYLETLQSKIKATSKNKKIALRKEDLRLPVLYYRLRKSHSGDVQVGRQLDKALEHLFSGNTKQAAGILNSIDLAGRSRR